MGDKMLVLSWKYHNVTFSNIISKFRDKGNYSDVTVACEGKFYPAHKLVLAACSEYFEDMFQHTTCNHPIVVLKDVTAKNLEALLSYMYSGVANISQDDLASLIHAAESLCIKGLAVPDDTMTDSTEAPAPASTTCSAAAAVKPKRRKRERYSGSTASQDGDYCEMEEHSTAGGRQEAFGTTRKVRDTDNSGNLSEPSLLLPTASLTHHNTGALECTPDVPFKSPLEDVVVKEELLESSPSLCYDSQLDCGPDGLTSITTTTTGGVEASHQPQNYLCPMEAGGGTVTDLQQHHQQQQQQQHQQQPPPPQHLTEAGMAGSSGIPQSLHESDGCYDGFPSLDGLNCEGQMDLYNQFNLQSTPFPLPQLGMEGSRRGKPHKLAGGAGRGGKLRSIKVHRCAHCSYSTPWHSVFVRHCRTHSGEKPFTCSFCPFRSSRKSVIKRHCLSKHS